MRDFDGAYSLFSYPQEKRYYVNGWEPQPINYREERNDLQVEPLPQSEIVQMNELIHTNNVVPFFYLLEWDKTEICGGFVIWCLYPYLQNPSDLDIITVDQEFVDKFKKVTGISETRVFKFENHTLFVFEQPMIHILQCNPRYTSTHQYMLSNFDMLNCMISITDTALWCPLPHARYRCITMSGMKQFDRPGVKDRLYKYMLVKGFVPDPTVRDYLLKYNSEDELRNITGHPTEFRYSERRSTLYE